MKLRTLSVVVVLLSLLFAVQTSAQKDFQSGKIISVEKRAAESSSGHTDSPSRVAHDVYDVAIEVNGTVYKCVYRSHPDIDSSWAAGKDVQVRLSGSKAIYVKRASGHQEKLSITNSEPAGK